MRTLPRVRLLMVALAALVPCALRAEERDRPTRREGATWTEIFDGPFHSSRVFALPTAHVVGAYQLSASGDASLLTEFESLNTTSVVALGFGDIAQLEYRGAAAVTSENLEDDETVLDTVGVQLQAPFRHGGWIPAVAAALRLGLDQPVATADGLQHAQRADDLYLVSSWSIRDRVALHTAVRISSASIRSSGDSAPTSIRKPLFLPAAGIEVELGRDARLAAEVALVPRFVPGNADRASDVDRGGFGRFGIRWRVHPAVIIDSSVGYRIELQRLEAGMSSMSQALVDWDLRLGAEVFVPWGAMACRSTGLFCQD